MNKRKRSISYTSRNGSSFFQGLQNCLFRTLFKFFLPASMKFAPRLFFSPPPIVVRLGQYVGHKTSNIHIYTKYFMYFKSLWIIIPPYISKHIFRKLNISCLSVCETWIPVYNIFDVKLEIGLKIKIKTEKEKEKWKQKKREENKGPFDFKKKQ